MKLLLLIGVTEWYNGCMVCFAEYKPTFKQGAAGKEKEPPKKRPLQISEELHGLISLLAKDNSQSLEQVVAGAVIQRAKSALNTPDNDRQRAYYERIKGAEQEIRQRYHGERSRRSAQMREINNERRIKIAPTPSTSPTVPPRSFSPSNHCDYPVEYRYGIPIPKPPASSYPTYSPSL